MNQTSKPLKRKSDKSDPMLQPTYYLVGADEEQFFVLNNGFQLYLPQFTSRRAANRYAAKVKLDRAFAVRKMSGEELGTFWLLLPDVVEAITDPTPTPGEHHCVTTDEMYDLNAENGHRYIDEILAENKPAEPSAQTPKSARGRRK